MCEIVVWKCVREEIAFIALSGSGSNSIWNCRINRCKCACFWIFTTPATWKSIVIYIYVSIGIAASVFAENVFWCSIQRILWSSFSITVQFRGTHSDCNGVEITDKSWKVKKFLYRPWQAFRTSGGWSSKNFQTIGTWRWQGYQPYAPAAITPQRIFLVLISLGGWVDLRALVRPERLSE
jgi:hypothetical protein